MSKDKHVRIVYEVNTLSHILCHKHPDAIIEIKLGGNATAGISVEGIECLTCTLERCQKEYRRANAALTDIGSMIEAYAANEKPDAQDD